MIRLQGQCLSLYWDGKPCTFLKQFSYFWLLLMVLGGVKHGPSHDCFVCNNEFYYVSGDTLMGQTSRIVVAEACVQALDLPCTIGQTYEINSIEVRSQFVHLS